MMRGTGIFRGVLSGGSFGVGYAIEACVCVMVELKTLCSVLDGDEGLDFMLQWLLGFLSLFTLEMLYLVYV